MPFVVLPGISEKALIIIRIICLFNKLIDSVELNYNKITFRMNFFIDPFKYLFKTLSQ